MENKYFELGNIIRYITIGALNKKKEMKYSDVYFIIYKNSRGTLPIKQIFENIIRYHKKEYDYNIYSNNNDKQLILDYLENLKEKFTEEELNLHPDYTAKDGHKHLSQKDDEMFVRGLLSPTN